MSTVRKVVINALASVQTNIDFTLGAVASAKKHLSGQEASLARDLTAKAELEAWLAANPEPLTVTDSNDGGTPPRRSQRLIHPATP